MEQLTCTLVFLVREDQILLARKKRGFGKDLWNGAGGKVEQGESIEQAMIRECQEEIGVTPHTYTKVALHTFRYIDTKREITVHTYLCDDWLGEPTESEEMLPEWFAQADIPYAHMWADDNEWLPLVLRGKTVRTSFTFGEGNIITNSNIQETDNLEHHG